MATDESSSESQSNSGDKVQTQGQEVPSSGTQGQAAVPSKTEAEKESGFEIPSWAGKPPQGYHLDVSKNGDQLLQKLMIDEKRCYFFGRNPKLCDFAIDHASCSRIHAALVYHKQLQRFFLVDLGSTHGTFIGKVRLEANKIGQLNMDAQFHFGASTRYYALRANLKSGQESEKMSLTFDHDGKSILPEHEDELENLTEYNTAMNRRIGSLPISDPSNKPPRRKQQMNVVFHDEDAIINPEDVDPSVGRFRNLVQTAVIPNKRQRLERELTLFQSDSQQEPHHVRHYSRPGDPDGASGLLRRPLVSPTGASALFPAPFASAAANLGIALPNPAPDVDSYRPAPAPTGVAVSSIPTTTLKTTGVQPQQQRSVPPVLIDATEGGLTLIGPKKKKYAKEAWPGKKPQPSSTHPF